jgi:hypothetical protein
MKDGIVYVMIRVKRSEYVNKRKRKGKGTLLNINIITTSDESGNESGWKTLGRNNWEAPLYLLHNTPYKTQDTRNKKYILHTKKREAGVTLDVAMRDDDWISGDKAAETKGPVKWSFGSSHEGKVELRDYWDEAGNVLYMCM